MRIIENENFSDETNGDDSSENKTEILLFEDIEEENVSIPEEEDATVFTDDEETEIEEIYSDSSLDPSYKEDTTTQEEVITEPEIVDRVLDDNDEIAEEISDEEKTSESEEKKMNFFVSLWKNKRRRAKIAYSFVSFVLIIVSVGYGFVNAFLDKVAPGEENNPQFVDGPPEEVIFEEEDFDLFNAVNSAGSLNDYVAQWYDSGESMYSKNVINVLLVGLDSKDGLTTGSSRSDTMMIVSLNTKTKKISMVSLFRDTWAKFISADGETRFGKMNGSYRYGGINSTVQTIEKMFKIKIDHYAIVDFRNFKKLVNAVGGVDLYVQEYEAKNMKREWNIDIDFSKDENDLIHLDGEQAFWFARQRHSDADADVSRTRRQRQVITAFIESCKGASLSQITDALNSIFGFIKTDLTKNEIISYATKALTYGWLNYPIETIHISDSSIFRTPTIIVQNTKQSIVVQDYPKVAQIIQEGLYGSTNIVLEDDRKIVFSLLP